MIELSSLSRDQLHKELHEMFRQGEIVALLGMRVQSGGGMGTILTGEPNVIFSGRPVATVGSQYLIPAEAHGCVSCPHCCSGVIITGSSRVFANGKPVAIMGSQGAHAGGCGPGTAIIAEGAFEVAMPPQPLATAGA